ncbi:protein-(glutamine-N5) methyltransferase, release factor-specific [Chitinophaga caeni]|uniref:peptide chain release factor N(5)-glutamine methyltransferase n=1 Tax=Chitinophaga caeni TaxID=2029983 RepID=A0A291QV31_9BACT|nr:peptide chain release factor N(5)-glutamine methyltransferase [Chitinophaga caeni]ATL47704.1 protein-(glutamine-N5) methyltransferase, release factor-specific [Chitinophaga caeni]
MTIQSAFAFALQQLQSIYDSRESATIANILLEHISGYNKMDRILFKDESLDASQEAKLLLAIQSLLAHQPLQYIIEAAWFYGMQFYVNQHVLIPRPETEELVSWVLEEQHTMHGEVNIIDIGTGSGCIPISIKKHWEAANVYGIDLSETALEVARKNAEQLQVEVNFTGQDILRANALEQLPTFDIIVSNPPYIKESEKKQMQKNVLDYEPGIALFVPDHDPMLFYRTIASIAMEKLRKGGKIFFEINEAHAPEVEGCLHDAGFHNVLRKQDIFGKDRMVSGRK